MFEEWYSEFLICEFESQAGLGGRGTRPVCGIGRCGPCVAENAADGERRVRRGEEGDDANVGEDVWAQAR